MPAKRKKNEDVTVLLERTRLLLNSVGKIKVPKKCKVCDEIKSDLFHGICGSCREARAKEAGEKREGKIWFRPDGYACTYDSSGKPVLYSRFRMAQILGRTLDSDESVSYKDRNRGNIADDNLVLVSKIGVVVADLVCPHCNVRYGDQEIVEPHQDSQNL